MISGLIGLALAFGIQSADTVSVPEVSPDLPVSLVRIRADLARPAPLRIALPKPKADFHVEIRERPLYSPNLLGPVETLWSTTPGPVPPGGLRAFEQRQRLGEQWSQPMLSVDLLSIAASVRTAITNARRSSAEKAAREEVRRALAEFCSTHECER
jgi:hypothetical protein